jgi:hypothetical protein
MTRIFNNPAPFGCHDCPNAKTRGFWAVADLNTKYFASFPIKEVLKNQKMGDCGKQWAKMVTTWVNVG